MKDKRRLKCATLGVRRLTCVWGLLGSSVLPRRPFFGRAVLEYCNGEIIHRLAIAEWFTFAPPGLNELQFGRGARLTTEKQTLYFSPHSILDGIGGRGHSQSVNCFSSLSLSSVAKGVL